MEWFVGVLVFVVIVSLFTALRRGEMRGWPRGYVRGDSDDGDDAFVAASLIPDRDPSPVVDAATHAASAHHDACHDVGAHHGGSFDTHHGGCDVGGGFDGGHHH